MQDRGIKRWRCVVCGYEVEGLEPPPACPVCDVGSAKFEALDIVADGVAGPVGSATPGSTESKSTAPSQEGVVGLDKYLSKWVRQPDSNPDFYEAKYARISDLAKGGKSRVSGMGTRRSFPGMESLLLRGAQCARTPLDAVAPVSLRTVIGPSAKRPLVLDLPFYVSHMSFGALSKEAKIALAMGAELAGTATCSGEGGMLTEECEQTSRYIYEIGTAAFCRSEDAIKKADAVEIKFGQAAKPGMGGYLSPDKVTSEIAAVRGIKPGESFTAPSHQTDLRTSEDLRRYVCELRRMTDGKPIGVKFAAGHIEDDLEFVLAAEPDFITIDCRGGGTGGAPDFVKYNHCLPLVFAIRHARRFLDGVGSKVTLCITGGLRDSTDIAKALALGADAVALATASLIAIGCQQYRICDTGRCPVGITTQDTELRSRFSIEASRDRFVNFAGATAGELRILSRINGRADIHGLNMSDIFTISGEVADHTDIEFA